jgi:hypothetical protein
VAGRHEWACHGRQVWVISRHYSDDTRMGLLLQRIACRLADRVAASLDIAARTWPLARRKSHHACRGG